MAERPLGVADWRGYGREQFPQGSWGVDGDVLRAGLQTATWITVDDTSARHKASNCFCTQIGNDGFAWFGTTKSKSRLNFLDLLRAGYTDYVVNDAALSYMRDRALAGQIIARLAEHPDKQFADPQAWRGHLEQLGMTELTVTPNRVKALQLV